VNKTFLFIGFSFTDPNLDYIMSRVRVTFQSNQRRHYCIIRKVKQDKGETSDDFRYRQIKQDLEVENLLRFNIKALLVDEFHEITDILGEIEARFKRKTIFISGSAAEYGRLTPAVAEDFTSNLTKALLHDGFKIVSGFGLGVGSHVITGALHEIYVVRREKLRDQLQLRPFPQGTAGKATWDAYRQDILSHTGVAIFLFGNKLESGKIVNADGMKKEFEIALAKGNLVLPIGWTGFMSRELWERVFAAYEDYYPGKANYDLFVELGRDDLEAHSVIELIINFLHQLNK
jgi:hypothetical protein